jgi:hypothetical protein
MAKINKANYLAFFLLGIFIGGVTGVILINALISYRVDNYIKEIQHLKTVIEDKNNRFEKLEESIEKKRFIVKDIEVELKYENEDHKDDITRIVLERHIKDKFKGLIGKDVDKIDGEILYEIIDRRIMKLDGKEYQLSVKKMIIAQVIKFDVSIKVI